MVILQGFTVLEPMMFYRLRSFSSTFENRGSNISAHVLLDWPQSLMSICLSKTDNLSQIEIFKLYLEVEVLGLDSKFDYQRG